MEEFQQRTNAVSLEKVKAYYRRLRYAEPATAPPAAPEAFHVFKREKFSPSLREHAPAALSLFPSERRSEGLCCFLKVGAASLISGSADVFQGLCPSLHNDVWEFCGVNPRHKPAELRRINKK